jgi:predicted RNA binding protein YcfA (HicA-like mRNA interferase family)
VTRRGKLLARTRNNPRDVRFSDLLTLVDAAGYVFKRQVGSHRQYWHPRANVALNLQPDSNGKAKPYQVREFLDAVDDHGLTVKETEG